MKTPRSHAPRAARPQRRSAAARPRRRSDGGAVLLVMMLLVLTLLGLGVMGLWLTSGNLQVQANNNLRAQALVVAEAGVERARALLNAGIDVDAMLAGRNPTLDDVPVALDAGGRPSGVGAVFVDGTTPLNNIAFPPGSFGRTGGTAQAPLSATMGTYTVWIRNDTAECRQGKYLVDSNGSVLIRSRGLAADNLTTVVLEVAMGGAPGGASSGTSTAFVPVLCNSGKNSCDDNSSTVSGVVVN